MSIKRSIKCAACGFWNKDQTHCAQCGALIDFKIARQIEEEHRVFLENSRAKDRFDRFLASWQKSRWWPLRLAYWLLYSLWFILFTVVSFFLYMVAAGPG